MNGRANLTRLAFAARKGRPLPADVAEWLAVGIERYESGEDLADALHLRTTAQLRQERDRHLIDAAALMPGRWSVAQRARRMRAAAPGLEAHLSAGCDHLEGWRAELFKALQSAPLPGDRRLRQIVGSPAPDCQIVAVK